MAGFHISWEIEGVTELSRNLRGIETSLKDFKKPLTRIAKSLVKSFGGEVFDTQGAVIGERWKRLSPYTVAQKARLGFPADTLVRTGAMKKGFKSVVTSDQAVIGNTQDYFRYHQSNKPRSHIPRRVMMKLNENMKEMIVKEFQNHIRLNK